MPLRVIDFDDFAPNQAGIDLIERLPATDRLFGRAAGTRESQKELIKGLKNHLTDRFTLLQNLVLPGARGRMPLILLGPAGVRLLNICESEGQFEARQAEWFELDARGEPRPAKINPLNETLKLNESLAEYFEHNRSSMKTLEPALLFTRPAAEIKTDGPLVKIVRYDAIQRYIESLPSDESLVSALEIEEITNSLIKEVKRLQAVEARQRKDWRGRLMRLPGIAFLRGLNLTTQQWTIIVVFLLLNVMILVAIAALFLYSP